MFGKWLRRAGSSNHAANSIERLTSSHLIELRDVPKVYESAAGQFTALKSVDLVIERGEFVAIIGKSGSGKSTLLNMITGIDRHTSGAGATSGSYSSSSSCCPRSRSPRM